MTFEHKNSLALAHNSFLKKLPGTRREPAGLEWKIWKKLPYLLIAGTVIPAITYGLMVLFPDPDAGETTEKYLIGAEILTVALVLTVWTAVFTLAIGCFVVRVMKGPGYVADAYPLEDADHARNTSYQDEGTDDKPPS